MSFKDTLDALKGRATDLAQAGMAQSKRLAEIAKLKTANMTEEDAIKKAYVELGKLYYAEHGATPDGAYVAACEKITASKALIETNNERIAELKQSVDPESEAEVEAAIEVAEVEHVEAEAPAGEAPAEEAPAEEAPECPCCGGEEEKQGE